MSEPVRVEVNLNARITNNWTFVGFEDADGPLELDEQVVVTVPEIALRGVGWVRELDSAREIAILEVDWSSIE